MTSVPDEPGTDADLRLPAEEAFAHELRALAEADAGPRPPRWRLTPSAVVTYLLGGHAGDVEVTTKYVGDRRLMEIAVSTLATDRALLLLGVPGTAKSWVSEHLAAAICGTSRLVVQGTAGTPEEAIRYGWNYALLLAKGPTAEAVVESPVMRAMRAGAIARVEELTRIPSDVQDGLISVLSEKSMAIPELGSEVGARKGFSVIATANSRDKGVNDLSSALRRRFNTVVLPPPATVAEEVAIVESRVAALGKAHGLPGVSAGAAEVRRVIQVFRELRNGVTEDGRAKVRSPSGPMSTAEAISTVNNGMALATYFGDGEPTARDMAAGLHAAVVQDPVQDATIWREYLEGTVRRREGWEALYSAARELA